VAPDRKRLIVQALEAERAVRSVLQREGQAPDVVDDILQQVYLRMWVSPSVPEEIQSMTSYMLTLARNIILDGIRHEKCVADHERSSLTSPSQVDYTDGVDEELNGKEMLQQLRRAFRSLPYLTRQVIWRRKVRGQSQQEIAQRLGVSIEAVESRLSRGRSLLDRALNDAMDEEERRKVMKWIWPQRRSHEDD
jgi:RNA polymerase sigma-70 factor (ECF subfamily)